MSQSSRETLEFVVPRIYVALPKSGPTDVKLAPVDMPVERRFMADLIILYAFDLDTHFQLVAQRDIQRLGVSETELHERALINLRALNLEVRMHGGSPVFVFTAGGNYEATLVFLPEIWEYVATKVPGNIIISIPARDIILATGDLAQENLGELRRSTSQALERSDKPLSRCFLRWTGNSWEEYTGFAD